jgi:hypothetical protein
MNEERLREILVKVSSGDTSVEEALERLRCLPFEDLSFAKVDHHRALRNGVGEVIYCPGKTPHQVREIVSSLKEHHVNILATRATKEIYEAIRDVAPDAVYHETARIVVINHRPAHQKGNVAVVCAGTSDLPVAEEAALTAETLGSRVSRHYDVGVAGIHRLLACREELLAANVLVVVAGMEGALPSVVGGLVHRPVIAVPTSIGYGANLQGLSAMLTMLNSCVPWVSVVNIDNGFGAGYQAHLINQMCLRGQEARRGP